MKSDEQMSPNHMLRRERELRGWSQSYVADLLQAPAPSYVSRWERGQTVPSPFYREKLCRIYEKNAKELGLLLIDEETVADELDDQVVPSQQETEKELRPQPPIYKKKRHPRHFFVTLGIGIFVLLTIVSLCCYVFLPPILQNSATESGRHWPTIAFNNNFRDENVRTLQYMLIAQGYDVGRSGVDGVFGTYTERAVRSFQQDHGLQPTGVVTSLVWEKLILPTSKGERGSVVQALQRQLNLFKPQLKLQRDGIYGPKVEQAVRLFQQEKHLPVHGRADLNTWCKLLGGNIASE